VSWLPDRLSQLKLLKLPISVRIEPVSWLLPRERDSKLVKLLNSVGIEPVSWLSLRWRDSKLVKLPNSVGIEPVSELNDRSSFDICPPLHSMPSQLQGIFVTYQLAVLREISVSHSVAGISVTVTQSNGSLSLMVTVAKFSPLTGEVRVIVKVSGFSNLSSSVIVIVNVFLA